MANVTTVGSIIGDPGSMISFGQAQAAAAQGYILRLGDVTAGLAAQIITPVFPPGPSAPTQITTALPVFQPVAWTAPTPPPAFTGVLDVNDLMPAPFLDASPQLSFGTAPTFNDVAPDAPAIDTSFVMPTLSVTLPAAPSLLSLNVVPFGGLNIPAVDFTIPDMTVAAPSIREYTPGAQYTSSLLSATQVELLRRIQNGGTGLNPAVEGAIWDRGREREARSADDALAELDRMEAMNFALPPGGYAAGRIKIATETDYARRGYSREVMIKQAELEAANVAQALTDAIQLEGTLINYSNTVEQRLFDSSKYATEAGISIYNARVQAYGALIEAYKSRAQVYTAQVQAELSKVEAYKAQIEAENTKATINRVLVEQYQAQITAALSSVQIFEAQLGAIQTRAEIEKTKIEIFGEQVKAYASKVSAYTAGVEGFRAQIEAEGSKQAAFKSQVDAYSARVEAGVKIVEGRIEAFKGNLEASTAAFDAYKSTYQAESARAQAIAAGNSSLADAFRAEVAAITSFNETQTKQWQVVIDQSQRVTEIGVKAAEANSQLYVTTRSLALDAAKVGAQVTAQLGAAALNAVNWSSSYSASNSASDSFGISRSDSYSDSKSTSYNYNYSV